MTVIVPLSLCGGHSVGVFVRVKLGLLGVDCDDVFVGSDVALVVVFQFHGKDVPFKVYEDPRVGKEVSSLVLESVIQLLGRGLVLLVCDDVGNSNVGL